LQEYISVLKKKSSCISEAGAPIDQPWTIIHDSASALVAAEWLIASNS